MSNLTCFQWMVRKCEGTDGPNGYRMLFGGKLFDNGFIDHPHIYEHYQNKRGDLILTSAAGAYQMVYSTWKEVAMKLHLTNFSPHSQDLGCAELIREAGALPDIAAGHIDVAIGKCRHIWASLPGAGYSQPEKTLEQCIAWYKEAGGTVV